MIASICKRAVLFSLITNLCVGANHYVLDGGSGDGSSWSSAWDDLPSTLTRGDTYYIGDGTYSSYTFDDAASGSTYIYITKAIESDHGTGTGWDSSYGDGQAVFGKLEHNESSGAGGYIDIDGQFQYGFKIDFDDGDMGFAFWRGGPHIKLRYIDFDGVATSGDYYYTGATRAVDVTPWNGSGYDDCTGLLISYCALHGAETLIQSIGGGDDIVVEYSKLYDSRSTNPAYHQNIWWIGGGHNGIFRYNEVYNWNVEGIFFTYGGQNNWKIHGNIFHSASTSGTPRGIEFRQDFSYGTNYILNNTFADISFAGVTIRGPASGGGTNNLFYNSSMGWGDMSHDYNWTTAANSEANGIGSGSDPFVDAANDDYRLAGDSGASWPRDNGAALAAEFNTDVLGNTRGGDSSWDMGAYEYQTGGDSGPPIITELSTGTPDHDSTIISWTTDENATSGVELGTVSGSLDVTVTNATLTTSHSLSITSLVASTTYYYEVYSADAFGNLTNTTEASFSTTAEAFISNVSSGTPSTNSATITWDTTSGATSGVEYGETVGYGSTATNEPAESVTSHSVDLTSLTPNTEYHYRVWSDAQSSSDNTFTTAAIDTVATPTDSPGAYSYVESQTVTLSCATDGATIYYTVDGTTPTESDTEYTSGFNVGNTVTIKAKAFKDYYTPSAVMSKDYTFAPYTASSSWQSATFTARSNDFHCVFTMSATATNIDGVIGLASSPAAEYTDVAAIVRMANTGYFDARDGGSYTKDATVNYSADTQYAVRVEVSFSGNTYDVYVDDQLIADDYNFRTEQSAVSSLSFLSFVCSTDPEVFTVGSTGINDGGPVDAPPRGRKHGIGVGWGLFK